MSGEEANGDAAGPPPQLEDIGDLRRSLLVCARRRLPPQLAEDAVQEVMARWARQSAAANDASAAGANGDSSADANTDRPANAGANGSTDANVCGPPEADAAERADDNTGKLVANGVRRQFSYLCGVLDNVIKEIWRNESSMQRRHAELGAERVTTGPCEHSPEQLLEKHQRDGQLERTFAELSRLQRTILFLSFDKRMTVGQIAARLRRDVAEVKEEKAKARARLTWGMRQFRADPSSVKRPASLRARSEAQPAPTLAVAPPNLEVPAVSGKSAAEQSATSETTSRKGNTP